MIVACRDSMAERRKTLRPKYGSHVSSTFSPLALARHYIQSSTTRNSKSCSIIITYVNYFVAHMSVYNPGGDSIPVR